MATCESGHINKHNKSRKQQQESTTRTNCQNKNMKCCWQVEEEAEEAEKKE